MMLSVSKLILENFEKVFPELAYNSQSGIFHKGVLIESNVI